MRSHCGLIKADDGVVAEVERVQLQPGQRGAQVATAQGQKLLIGQTHTHPRKIAISRLNIQERQEEEKCEHLQGVEALGACEDLQLGVDASKTLETVWRNPLQLDPPPKKKQKTKNRHVNL